MKTQPFFLYDYSTETQLSKEGPRDVSVPRTTVAIVPRIVDGQVDGLGIGVSVCSQLDNPVKKVGRKQALKRAAFAISNKSMGYLELPGRSVVGHAYFRKPTARVHADDPLPERVIDILRNYQFDQLLSDDAFLRLLKACQVSLS